MIARLCHRQSGVPDGPKSPAECRSGDQRHPFLRVFLAAGILAAFSGFGFLQDSAALIATVFLSALLVVALLIVILFAARKVVWSWLFGFAEVQIEQLANPLASVELLSNLVFEGCRSCGDLVWVCGFNSVFERDAGDDFGEAIKAAWFSPVLLGALSQLEDHVQHAIA